MDGEAKVLQQIIQLVVLVIPLIVVPIIIKSRNDIMRSVSGYADRFSRAAGLEKGMQKGRESLAGNAKKRAAFAGANLSERLQNTDRLGGAPARLTKSMREMRRNRAAKSSARDLALDARKQEREADIQERMGELIGTHGAVNASRLSAATVRVGGEKVENYAASAQHKAFNERVGNIQAKFEMQGTDVALLGNTLSKAIRDGDRETATAAIKRLSQMGAGGVEEVATRLQGGRSADGSTVSAPVISDPQMQTTVGNAINDGSVYGALVEKSGDVAKGGFDSSTGTWKGNFHSLSTGQVAGLSPKAMERYASEVAGLKSDIASGRLTGNDLTKAQEQVQRASDHVAAIRANESLSGKISDPDSQKALQRMS